MAIRRFTVVATTAGGAGAATAYSPKIFGKLESIRYVKTDFADGATYTITGETSGQGIWTEAAVNASTVRHPRAATHSTVGVASLRAAGGTPVLDRIALGGERVKIAVTTAGADDTYGTFHITVDG